MHFDNFFRWDAEFFDAIFNADPFLLDGIEHPHAFADKLHEVFVGGDDDDFFSLCAGKARIGGDEIVSFVAFHFEGGNIEGLCCFADERELRDQVRRRFVAVLLIFGIDFIAKVFAGGVEYHGQIRRVIILEHFDEHTDEAVDRADF